MATNPEGREPSSAASFPQPPLPPPGSALLPDPAFGSNTAPQATPPMDELKKFASEDLVTELSELSDKYATAIGKYAPLAGSTPNPNPTH